MSTHFMFAFAKAVDGRKDELNEWFETQHVPDLLQIPGFVSARRVAVRPLGAREGIPVWDFMAIYEIDAEDVQAVIKESGVRMASGVIKMSAALDRSSSLALLGSPISFRQSSGFS
ncbi:MAG: hypothetical protein JWO52_7753 [Gammaproteobacteria bacterium]|jgi:hypothetical protein|nr:hypothetical protein [Gammaproteobacteria bacterium]